MELEGYPVFLKSKQDTYSELPKVGSKQDVLRWVNSYKADIPRQWEVIIRNEPFSHRKTDRSFKWPFQVRKASLKSSYTCRVIPVLWLSGKDKAIETVKISVSWGLGRVTKAVGRRFSGNTVKWLWSPQWQKQDIIHSTSLENTQPQSAPQSKTRTYQLSHKVYPTPGY